MIGVDSSPEMLAEAPAGDRVEWVKADLRHWRPASHPDLYFANASLHWLDDHATLFPRLVEELAPAGVLAVQMPRNQDRATHRAVFEVVSSGPWSAILAPLVRPDPVAEPSWYLRLLAPLTSGIRVWEVDYLQLLAGPDPVLNWVRGSLLRPLLGALPADMRSPFLDACRRSLALAYPPEPDGRVLLPFRRLFLIAERGGS